MEEENKNVGTQDPTEPKTTEGTEPKAENPERTAKKAKKAEKASFGQRVKTGIKNNKKTIIGTIAGFVTGVGTAIGGSMWLGHRHRKAEEEALRAMPMNPDGSTEYSPLDPNSDI